MMTRKTGLAPARLAKINLPLISTSGNISPAKLILLEFQAHNHGFLTGNLLNTTLLSRLILPNLPLLLDRKARLRYTAQSSFIFMYLQNILSVAKKTMLSFILFIKTAKENLLFTAFS